jgi:hypothetical protein
VSLPFWLSWGHRPRWRRARCLTGQDARCAEPRGNAGDNGITICVRGWTQTVRPPQAYTHALKRQQIREFGYADRHLGAYEEDHLVPLGLGGAPYDPRNLWPEPRATTDGWNADVKDELEAVLVRRVCSG